MKRKREDAKETPTPQSVEPRFLILQEITPLADVLIQLILDYEKPWLICSEAREARRLNIVQEMRQKGQSMLELQQKIAEHRVGIQILQTEEKRIRFLTHLETEKSTVFVVRPEWIAEFPEGLFDQMKVHQQNDGVMYAWRDRSESWEETESAFVDELGIWIFRRKVDSAWNDSFFCKETGRGTISYYDDYKKIYKQSAVLLMAQDHWKAIQENTLSKAKKWVHRPQDVE